MIGTKARVCIVGPHIRSSSPHVISQGEVLGRLMSAAGFPVRTTSRVKNGTVRALDAAKSLVLWRDDVDVVLLMVFSGRAFAAADLSSRIASMLKKRLIVALHGGELPRFALRHPGWVRSVLARADRIVAPSPYLADYFRSGGYQVEVVPNVLELDKYPYQPRTGVGSTLLWMRAFHDLYQPEVAIEVVEKLKPRHPKIKLTMAGPDKGAEARMKRLVAGKNLTGSVRFAGFLDEPAKRKEFGSHDVFLNTTRTDNMPVSLMEAAAFGLPIVSTNVGGIPLLLEHELTGLLVDPGDPGAMADQVDRLLLDPELVSRLSSNARQLVEGYSWEAVRGKWEALIEGVTSDA